MSKAGVTKTQGFRKPRKRKKVVLEERVIDGEVVVGKECTKCGEWKPLESGFHNCKTGTGGKKSICRVCTSTVDRNYREENKEVIREYSRKWRKENKDHDLIRKRKWAEYNREIYTRMAKK